ncbi:MAG: hypothetical protein R3B96_04490 [Pirellulaceae bacterium]
MSLVPSPGRSDMTPTGRWSFLDSALVSRHFDSLRWFATACLLLTALWLALRPRDWPVVSVADWGGLGLVGLALVVSAGGVLRHGVFRGHIALPCTIALLLIGHVGGASAVLLILLALLVTASLLLWHFAQEAPAAQDNRAQNSVTDPNTFPTPRGLEPCESAPSDPPPAPARDANRTDAHVETDAGDDADEELEPSDEHGRDLEPMSELERRLLSQLREPNVASSEGDPSDEAEAIDEAEEEVELASTSQQWRRWSDDGREYLEGFTRVELPRGAQLAWVHVPIWPPLADAPDVEVWLESESSDGEVAAEPTIEPRSKVTQVLPHGLRIEIRLPSATPVALRVTAFVNLSARGEVARL